MYLKPVILPVLYTFLIVGLTSCIRKHTGYADDLTKWEVQDPTSCIPKTGAISSEDNKVVQKVENQDKHRKN